MKEGERFVVLTDILGDEDPSTLGLVEQRSVVIERSFDRKRAGVHFGLRWGGGEFGHGDAFERRPSPFGRPREPGPRLT